MLSLKLSIYQKCIATNKGDNSLFVFYLFLIILFLKVSYILRYHFIKKRIMGLFGIKKRQSRGGFNGGFNGGDDKRSGINLSWGLFIIIVLLLIIILFPYTIDYCTNGRFWVPVRFGLGRYGKKGDWFSSTPDTKVVAISAVEQKI